MSNNCKIIIQARTQSTRLPNKILLPFYMDKGILEIQIERLLQRFSKNQIIVATTVEEADSPIINLCKKLNIEYYRGSEENVLSRFISCAEEFELQSIIRVCSDNAFLDIGRIHQLFEKNELFFNRYDYASFSVNDTPGIKTHYGIWSEWVSSDALRKVATLTDDQLYKEHVTNYIYANNNVFSCYFEDVDFSEKQNIRLTTDTAEDFNMQKELFTELVEQHGMNFTTNHIFEKINEQPEFVKTMLEQIQRNEK